MSLATLSLNAKLNFHIGVFFVDTIVSIYPEAEASDSSETFLTIYQNTWHNTPEDSHLNASCLIMFCNWSIKLFNVFVSTFLRE
jgi:hypothetical protein